jgi:hypothetical protein
MPNFDNFKNECNPNHICVNDEHEVKTTNLFSWTCENEIQKCNCEQTQSGTTHIKKKCFANKRDVLET